MKKKKELIINDCEEGIKIENKCKSVYNMKNNKFNGEYQVWHKNGQLWIKCYYKNDKLNGEYLWWYKNGQLLEKGYYKNDKLTGEYREWYENGQLLRK